MNTKNTKFVYPQKAKLLSALGINKKLGLNTHSSSITSPKCQPLALAVAENRTQDRLSKQKYEFIIALS